MKKLLSILFAIALCFALIGCSTDETPNVETEVQPQQEQTEVPEQKTEIIIKGGEIGEYGSEIKLNADTEFEETQIVYHIPSGTYTVTNKGPNMNQFNIYSDETVKNEDGWEEPKENVLVKLLDVDKSVEFTIEENQHIYVADGEWQIVKK